MFSKLLSEMREHTKKLNELTITLEKAALLDIKPLITIEEARSISGFGKTKIHEWISQEFFESKILGGKRMINRKSFLQFLVTHKD